MSNDVDSLVKWVKKSLGLNESRKNEVAPQKTSLNSQQIEKPNHSQQTTNSQYGQVYSQNPTYPQQAVYSQPTAQISYGQQMATSQLKSNFTNSNIDTILKKAERNIKISAVIIFMNLIIMSIITSLFPEHPANGYDPYLDIKHKVYLIDILISVIPIVSVLGIIASLFSKKYNIQNFKTRLSIVLSAASILVTIHVISISVMFIASVNLYDDAHNAMIVFCAFFIVMSLVLLILGIVNNVESVFTWTSLITAICALIYLLIYYYYRYVFYIIPIMA